MPASVDDVPASTIDHRSLEHIIQEYKTIIKTLTEKLKEVTIMNDKWQKYNDDRDTYVEGVRTELKGTKKRLRDSEKELSETRARNVQFEKTVKDQQKTIANFSRLMDELDEKDDRARALVVRVKELEGEVDSLRGSRGRKEKDTEGVKILQEQLEVCIDDFKTERKEKEKFKREALTLRKKSTETDHILRDYREKVAWIKSLEFPSIPSEPNLHHKRHIEARRKTNTHPRTHMVTQRLPVKSNSWSYPSFPASIEADHTEDRGKSASEGAVQIEGAAQRDGAESSITAKPLIDLSNDCDMEEETQVPDSVFLSGSVEYDLIRH